MKLALGTVQFGMCYGVANTSGQPGEAEVVEILRLAAAAGVKVLDTAHLYGDAESVLGRCLPSGHAFNIVSKTEKFAGLDATTVVSRLETSFAESCKRLRSQQLYGLLVHDPDDLLGPAGEALWRAMTRMREEGRIGRIGVSVYCGWQIDELLRRYPLDLVQLPLSLLDQRLITGGQIDRLAEAGVEIHARSAFLQGALLMQAESLPPHLIGLRPYLEEIARCAGRLGITLVQAALRFVADLPQVAAVVCGVDSAQQFRQLVEALASDVPKLSAADSARCTCADVALVNPPDWRGQ